MERMIRLNVSRYKLFATVLASIGLLLLSFIFIIQKDDSIVRKRQNELTSLNGRSFWMLWAMEEQPLIKSDGFTFAAHAMTIKKYCPKESL